MSSEAATADLAIAAVAGGPVEPNEDGLYEIRCWTDYVLASSEPIDLPQGLGRLLSQPEDAVQRYIVNFGDYVGRMSLPGMELLITSSKLDAEGFDRLLQDVSGHCAALPFDFNSPTFVPYERESLTIRICSITPSCTCGGHCGLRIRASRSCLPWSSEIRIVPS